MAARGPELLGEMDARAPGGRTDGVAASAPMRSGQMRIGVLRLKPRIASTRKANPTHRHALPLVNFPMNVTVVPMGGTICTLL